MAVLRAGFKQKDLGAYYTPEKVVASLLRWAIREETDRLLDPSCGDGRFICRHRNSVGIEQDPTSAATAAARAPWALIHEGDFFAWANDTLERFTCAAGNPPFIRYQRFSGETRERALRFCASRGVDFSGLTSSWAPFLVATASLLKRGGRMAFIVPAEIGHAPYASPLLEYLVANFSEIHVVAVREKLFPELSEDVWLLYASDFGGCTRRIRFSSVSRFLEDNSPPSVFISISLTEWRSFWRRRLRPYLLPKTCRDFYQEQLPGLRSIRFGQIADIGIGYVSGGNDFFHLTSRDAERLHVPDSFLLPSVVSAKMLPAGSVTESVVQKWRQDNSRMLLLNLPKSGDLPSSIRSYLDSDVGKRVRLGYKCRNRDPWYAVPDVQVPDFFLSYMSGVRPNLVRNAALCTCSNAVHSVRIKRKGFLGMLANSWNSPIMQLSCEVEGHPLGGGMLKLEPGEAGQILLPLALELTKRDLDLVEESIAIMRSLRHYG